MPEFIFTFGVGTPYCKRFIAIEATSSHIARQRMTAVMGPNFAFQYNSRELAGVDKFHLTELPLEEAKPSGGMTYDQSNCLMEI